MRKRTKPTVKEDVTCNLIPMVDIMFLLLLFFILGADMTQREQADLVLPTASEIQENDKVKSEDPTTTVNVQHKLDDEFFQCPINTRGDVCRADEHWVIVVRGREVPLVSLKEQLQIEAEEAMEPDVDPIAGVRLSARKIVIRADRLAPYGYVNKIIETCSLVGIYKVEVGAAVPPK